MNGTAREDLPRVAYDDAVNHPVSMGRTDGYLTLEQYGVLGDGRSIALAGIDGSIDWWCVPNLDSPPLFNRSLDPEQGGRFELAPHASFTSTHR